MDCVVFRLLNLTKISSSMYQLLLELVQYLPKHILRELTVFNLGRTYPSYYNADFWEEPLSHSTEQILGENWKQINPMVLQAKKKKEAWAVLCRNGINIISFFWINDWYSSHFSHMECLSCRFILKVQNFASHEKAQCLVFMTNRSERERKNSCESFTPNV